MADKPRRPILHLKLTPPDPAEEIPRAPKLPVAPPVRPALGVAAGRKTLTVREFTPAPRPARPPRPPRAAAPAAKPSPLDWKCKPCGKSLAVPPELGDEDPVRCPSCNARLGLARDFRSDPPNLAKVRARMVAKA
jgi:hypothetical protein